MKQFEAFRLDTANECLWHNGAQIVLPPKPFAVLRYLIEHPGRLVSHDELLDALWPETYVQPQVLRTYVLDLRKALGDDAGQPRFIQTLPKRGYSFVARVVDAPESKTQSENLATCDSELVGRINELAVLDAQFEQMAGGRRSVVLVTGEAGIGKTALIDAFCRKIEQTQTTAIARGQCIQGVGSREDLYPVLEALNHLCGSPDGELACRVLAKLAPAWLAHGSTPNAVTDSSLGAPVQEKTLSSLCSALEEMSVEKPLLLVFEDLDWADEPTLHLISALARRRVPSRLMLLCTFRQNRGTVLQQLKQDLLRRRLAIEIPLSPLSRPAIAQLMARELKSEKFPAGLDRLVYQRAEGNPLFATAILQHLTVQRVLVCEGGRGNPSWKLLEPLDQLEAVIPDQLASVIEMDIARLSAEEQTALEAASLMNIAFPVWAVAAALEETVSETEEICDGSCSTSTSWVEPDRMNCRTARAHRSMSSPTSSIAMSSTIGNCRPGAIDATSASPTACASSLLDVKPMLPGRSRSITRPQEPGAKLARPFAFPRNVQPAGNRLRTRSNCWSARCV